ncbi:phosphatase PAP2 family protein [Streptomyces sp. ME19-01-6]|uniref:phosphatase PAP2 family protein n=1 Tax=Streptomyces sp. ME19-01-6 TaxID=3028686 RepID=UPI0029AAE92E|nr:phosphatase PAP2 family protein [Streptomyces sp. ME19-01-6]MDX3227289.1 phosphatase PAP2 family protein [Streptomyces sp. ME19-01-6]
MESRIAYDIRRRVLGSLAALGAGVAALALLYPGGLGKAGPVEVTGGASVAVYRAVNGVVAEGPSGVGALLDLAADGLLVVLGVLLAWTGWAAVRRRSARGVAGVMLVGVGTAVAYAVSEALKLVVDEERPCRAVRGAELLADCPGTGDWSFPSNHATLAAGLAVGVALLRPRLAAVALPIGALVAVARVAAGVHYPHDVLAGAALGAAVVTVAVWQAAPPVARAMAVLLDRRGRSGAALGGG